MDGVTAQLDSGRFVLVVAAPLIPDGVERVLAYLNTQGLRVFAVEFSYFKKGDLEIFTPRVVVRPEPGRPRQAAPSAFDLGAFLAVVPERTQTFLEELLEGCASRHALLSPQAGGGVSVLARWKGSTRTVIFVGPTTSWLAVPKAEGAPPDVAFDTMRKAVQMVAPGILTGKNGWFKTELFGLLQPQDADATANAIWLACQAVHEAAIGNLPMGPPGALPTT